MKEVTVREPPARLAGVDARAPLFFHANEFGMKFLTVETNTAEAVREFIRGVEFLL
jgi:hypothetical protein